MSNRLLAFDQSLNVSGWAFFIDGSLSKFGKFDTGSHETAYKLVEIRSVVSELIEELEPNEVAIEEIQLQQIPGSSEHGNVETYRKLAYAQATILELLAEQNIKHHIVPSSSWKSTCGVKGRGRTEQKRNAQAYVLSEYGVKAIQDICDSICIGKHILNQQSKEINWE